MNLFLDANIILDFYRYGKDDLSEIDKLCKLIEDKEVTLFWNRVVYDEVFRVREAVLAQSLKDIQSNSFSFRAPKFVAEDALVEQIKESIKSANSKAKELEAKSRKLIEEKNLPADKLIEKMFGLGNEIEITSAILERARYRAEINNPPRKKGDGIGDSIHWELLLQSKRLVHLTIVTRDGDFYSEISPDSIKYFLSEEWASKKGKFAEIVLRKSLSELFAHSFPKIKLSSEVEKDELITELASSGSFAASHSIVKQLARFDFFTTGQVDRIFKALLENNQVSKIARDKDIFDFYIGMKDKAFWIDVKLQPKIAEILGVDADEFFEIPF